MYIQFSCFSWGSISSFKNRVFQSLNDLQKIISTVASKAIEFLAACFTKIRERYFTSAVEILDLPNAEILDLPDELLRNEEGATNCVLHWTVYDYSPYDRGILPLLQQRYPDATFRCFNYTYHQKELSLEEQNFVKSAPNVFIVTQGPVGLVFQPEGQCRSCGLIQEWAEMHKEGKANLVFIDPWSYGNLTERQYQVNQMSINQENSCLKNRIGAGPQTNIIQRCFYIWRDRIIPTVS